MKAIEPSTRSWIRRNRGWVALATVGVLLMLATIPLEIWASKIHQNMEKEFASISPPANAEIIKAFSYPRTNTVGALYSANITYENLRDHYDRELKLRGWTYAGERSTAYRTERAGKALDFDKGPYTATLKYPGPLEAREVAYAFEFAIEWGWFESTVRRLIRFLRRGDVRR
jgi:hypothetical protein